MASVGVALGGLGLGIARRLTSPVGGRRYDLIIRGVDDSGERPVVALDRTQQTAAPGRYCLLLENGGWVRLSSEVEDLGPGLVGRGVLGETRAGLHVGERASCSGIYFSSPEDAGLEALDVAIPTDAGPAPAWLIRPRTGSSTTWAIHIHGLGSPRAGTLRGVQVAAETGLTSLVVTYRNDGEGPTTGSGRSTLGATEVDDVRAALQYALAHGARQVILFGWSMGAAIALQLAAEPGLRGIVAGLVLESPVLDWLSTIKANCKRSGLPSWTGALAVPWLDNRQLSRVTGLDAPVGLRSFDWITRADELATPTLILHGSADTSAPIGVAARLRDRRPDLVQLERFDADHTMTWNSDPERWRATVATVLAEHIGR
ncbi:alpha/beta hydrolase family protein [Agromyces bauzanensis]|uniref:Alpha/beta hydrolase n=1 Tax=Agromyces bauzanensis TaxID=1308924 RepID=A0A917PGA5_9MICO|nr:alpha/beta fold hydrolase [Agromyces bauzanensis]GGJ76596.1 alpha/beta hydrolase [Agromyces bauzanensis]